MTIIQRINQFIEKQGITIRAFEKAISASNGLIRKAIANNTDIQSKWLSLIVDNFPQINPIWLLTGNGEMLIEKEDRSIEQNSNKELPSKPPEAIFYYKMYKEKDAEVKALSEQIGALKQEISNLTDEITLMRISSQHSSSAEFARDVNAQRK